ncbi:HNH endonuclease domain-containing protein [Mycobacterium sp. TY814]|uniref:HNH endonuclease domain-containing protein n=1 Tax=unclassified Mycobacterium TaxID=2642494 RepID=UPI00274269B2|nr:HNH endonuclease domain-containing protein [Mycobacterium sp. TY814]MDP7724552.1 HNH endonuclease [Mycobacterium sp. TY814]
MTIKVYDGGTVDKATILERVCAALEGDSLAAGREILRAEYPFVAVDKVNRRYSERQCLRIFFRDGFTDRYSGARLVHPGALRALSLALPDDFPAHPNWAMSQTHIAFWELFPSIDHVVPVSRRGDDNDTNWVTTSMLRNSAKAHWTLEELNWTLLTPCGDCTEWDGLTGWFVRYVDRNPEIGANEYIRRWLAATKAVLAERRQIALSTEAEN